MQFYLNVYVINNCISQQNRASYTIKPEKLIKIYKMCFLLSTDECNGTVVCFRASSNYDRALLSINTCWLLHSHIHFHLFTARQTELRVVPRPATECKLCTISNLQHMLLNQAMSSNESENHNINIQECSIHSWWVDSAADSLFFKHTSADQPWIFIAVQNNYISCELWFRAVPVWL